MAVAEQQITFQSFILHSQVLREVVGEQLVEVSLTWEVKGRQTLHGRGYFKYRWRKARGGGNGGGGRCGSGDYSGSRGIGVAEAGLTGEIDGRLTFVGDSVGQVQQGGAVSVQGVLRTEARQLRAP